MLEKRKNFCIPGTRGVHFFNGGKNESFVGFALLGGDVHSVLTRSRGERQNPLLSGSGIKQSSLANIGLVHRL